MIYIYNNERTKVAQIELWRDIGIIRGVDYTGYYQVSNKGGVRSLDRVITDSRGIKYHKKSNIMVPIPDARGYMKTKLSINGRHVTHVIHRLVAIVFIPNPFNKSQVNHIDSNPSNNNVENLEWVDAKENMIHSMEFGKRNSILQKDISDVIELYRSGQSANQIGKIYNVVGGTIVLVLKRNNITLRTPSQTASIKFSYNKERIISLYQSGLSLGKVANDSDIAMETVARILKANDIKVRGHKEAALLWIANKKRDAN